MRVQVSISSSLHAAYLVRQKAETCSRVALIGVSKSLNPIIPSCIKEALKPTKTKT